MRLRTILRVALLTLLTVFTAVPALAADGDTQAVAVRAGRHDDYGRIAFDWPASVSFSATSWDNTVEIRFERPLSIAVQTIPRGLPGLVTAAALDADGQTIRLTVSRAVELRVLRFDRVAVVDLFDAAPRAKAAIAPPPPRPAAPPVDAGTTDPAPQAPAAPAAVAAPEPPQAAQPARPVALAMNAPAPAAAAAPEPPQAAQPALPAALATDAPAPAVAAAPGPPQSQADAPFMSIVPREQGSFSRLMFDWDRVVDYKVERDGEDLIVRFNAPSLIEPLPKGAHLPRRFAAIDAKADGTATVVRVRTAKGATKLRHFQRGNRIVVDLMDAGPEEGGGRPAWAKQETVPIAGLAYAALEEKTITPAAPSASEMAKADATPPSALAPKPAPARPTAQVPAAVAPSINAPDFNPEATKPAPKRDVAAASEPAKVAETRAIAAMPPVAEKSRLEAAIAAAITAPTAAPGVSTDAAMALHVELPAAPVKPPALKVTADAIGNGVRLGFRFDRPTGGAVFTRMGYLWIVFSAPEELDLSGLAPAGPIARAFAGAEQVASADATVLRLALASEIGAQVVRTGDTWLVELMATPPAPRNAVSARVEPGTNGPGRVIVPITGAQPAVILKDPEVGDSLIVVPSSTPGFGVSEARSFVQFKVLPSAQGVVIIPRGDAIAVRPVAAGVEIASDEALLLSTDTTKPKAAWVSAANSDEVIVPPSVFDYAGWRHEELGDFTRARQKLQNTAAAAEPGPKRTERRLELARLLFVNGSAADGLGVLERIAAEDEEAARRPEYLALRGATRLLAGRFDEAARDLDNAALDGDPHVTLWRAALAASRGAYEQADSFFTAAGLAFQTLPTDFKRRFGLLAAQSALAVKNYPRAMKFLGDLRSGAAKASEKAEIDYLEAQIEQQNGKPKEALANYEKLAEGRESPVGVRAAFAGVELKLEHGEIQPDEAIKQLERLRTVWRGDAYERQVLRRLAALYAGKKDYMNALTALRDAVERFPDAPGTNQLRDQMFSLMHNLFVAGDAETLSPLEALGLYYEFEDSAPTGPAGGRIVEGLANKLIAIDLLDRAATLLTKQVAKSEGEERARLGGKLAEVKLLDGKPDDALATLKDSATAQMAKELRQERQRVAARATGTLGRPKEGLELITGDDSREANALRVDLYWDDQNWHAVAATVDRLYPASGTDLASLKPEDQARIMRATVARALAKDVDGLGQMRARFGDMMKHTSYAGAFDFMTSSMAAEGVDMKQLPKILANIDGVDSLTGKPAKTAKK